MKHIKNYDRLQCSKIYDCKKGNWNGNIKYCNLFIISHLIVCRAIFFIFNKIKRLIHTETYRNERFYIKIELKMFRKGELKCLSESRSLLHGRGDICGHDV